MSNSSRIVKNTMYLYIKTGLTVFIVLFTTRLILKSLGETDFGIYNIVGGVISMLGFLNTAMAVTIQRFLNYEQGKGNIEKQKTIFNVGVVFHIGIALILSIVLILLGFILFDGVLNIPEQRTSAAKIIYMCLIVSTAFTIMTVPYDACLNAHEDMLYYSIVGIIEAILKLVVALLVVYSSQDKLIIYGILMAIVPLISMTLMRGYCRMHYEECRLSLRKYYDKDTAKDLASFAGWNLLGTSSNYLGNYGNLIVMNHYFGAAINAVMGIANQLQGQLMVLSTGMLKALNPVISKEEGSGNSDTMLKYSLKGCEFSYFLLAIFAIPFFIETPVILDFWLGEVPEWTVLFVRLQLVRALLEQITVSLSKALEAKNKIKMYNLIVFIFNLLPIPILCLCYSMGLPPYYHYIVSILLMVIIPTISKIILCRKYCDLKIAHFFEIVVSPITVATILSLLACLGFRVFLSNKILTLILDLIVTTCVLSCISFWGLTRMQRNSVIQTIKNIMPK